jgi:hypothetical protein
MENKFKQYSTKEREKLISTFEPKGFIITPTSDEGYDVFDAYLLNPQTGVEHIIEAKCRNFTLDHLLRNYSAELIIEKHKYDALMKLSEDTGKKAYYVNFLSCGAVIIFDLSSKTHINWRSNYSPKYTAVSNGSSLRVQGFCNMFLSSIHITTSPDATYENESDAVALFNLYKSSFLQKYKNYIK